MKKKVKKHLIYHIINSLLPGILVLLGSFTTAGAISSESLFFALIASGIVTFSKFKEYFDSAESEYTNCLFNFVG
jgi:hypothetical protein